MTQRPAGRKPLPPGQALTERVEIRMTPKQRAKLDRLAGTDQTGAEWLRDRIDSAREPARPAAPAFKRLST